jgi:hypothetical protein
VTKRLLLASVAFLTLLAPTQAQQTPDTPTFIFRLSQFEGSDASCVLVQKNGKFHLERAHRKSLQVFEGTLAAEYLAALNRLLNQDRFQQLLPEAVSSSLLPTGLDELTISVPRKGNWMTLRFLSGVSNDRNRPLLDQFLKWKNDVLKGPHNTLSVDSGRNNCLPPGGVGLERRSE